MKTLGKPEANSDVINKQPTTLLIGYGWVGQHVGKYFTEALWTDERKNLYKVKNDELVEDNDRKFDLAFLQVPTPMKEDGSCNLDFIMDAVRTWAERVDLFIVRSTVTPGTTEYLNKICETTQNKARFVFQPEYIGETVGHPNLEPRRDPFIILGGDPADTQKAVSYWSTVLNANAVYHQLTSLEAEIVKYMENSFLGTKVLFVSEFARLCEAAGADFYKVREAWLADPRIGRSHTMYYPNNPGFSGKCLPKDINSIAAWGRDELKHPLEFMESVLKINAKFRENASNTVSLLPEKNPKNG